MRESLSNTLASVWCISLLLTGCSTVPSPRYESRYVTLEGMTPEYPASTQEQLCNAEAYEASQRVSDEIATQSSSGLEGLFASLGRSAAGASRQAYSSAKAICMTRAGYTLEEICVSNCTP